MLSSTFERKAFTLLTSLFIGSLVMAAVVSTKIINIFGFYAPAGVLAYSITFIVSDIISEIWGKERANEVIHCGFIALLTAIALSWAALYWTPAPFWHGQEGFASVLASTPRIVLASLLAYLVSQTNDVRIFHLLRRMTGGKHLWLRNNLSTIVSQLIDSTIFVTVAFYGVMPVTDIIIGQWVAKVAIAFLDTPLVYAGVSLLRQRTPLGTASQA
ncbi:queuosine precursor transporter [Desulfovibrio sp. JC010]|uniref:queuosine precursor transporter n=1 Tax=Desulfovibrio sp. JC010 TaxID=2593641 RepID=UPI0013CF8863|nr:queuosine precursor transporter [Desulfovibrio sp. JC010]NDV27456.1 queuosine precursor transporter [Desulfovibrio sp. JC010]